MEMESKSNAPKRKALLILNCVLLFIGICVGPLIMRLYYIHGGKRVWLSSWLETGGWPIILIPILINYYRRRRTTSDSSETKKLFFIKPHLFLASAGIGIITGLDSYFYAYGIGRLPVSTSSLIIASQLAFTAVFAFFMVKQKFTSYSINAVVLLTTGAAVLALHTSRDRSKGETEKEYVVGFLMTVAAAVLYAFILPLMELTYKKARQEVTYTVVLEMQMVISFFATIVCTVGMFINNDFKLRPGNRSAWPSCWPNIGPALVWAACVDRSSAWASWRAWWLGVVHADKQAGRQDSSVAGACGRGRGARSRVHAGKAGVRGTRVLG
ncbi:hypothetical protein UlMin_034779 [Ulmus minor]